MAEAWTYEKRGDIGVVMDENGLPVCMRVSEEDGELIASAPRLAERVRILREVANQIILEDEQNPGVIPGDIVAGARSALEATMTGVAWTAKEAPC